MIAIKPTNTFFYLKITQAPPPPASTRLGLKQKYWLIQSRAGVWVRSQTCSWSICMALSLKFRGSNTVKGTRCYRYLQEPVPLRISKAVIQPRNLAQSGLLGYRANHWQRPYILTPYTPVAHAQALQCYNNNILGYWTAKAGIVHQQPTKQQRYTHSPPPTAQMKPSSITETG